MLTIYDAFLPLAERLSKITGKYVPCEGLENLEYGEIASNIQTNASRFPVADRYKVMEEYHVSVSYTLEKLMSKVPDEIKNIPRHVNPNYDFENPRRPITPLPEEVFLLEELEFYKDWLKEQILLLNEQMQTIHETREVISLPERFRLADFNQLFESGLSPEQSVLFLNYLVVLKLIPNYNYSSLGTLTKFLFGKSDDNARKDFGNIHSLKTKADLKAVKTAFSSIVAEIDNDLLKAKK